MAAAASATTSRTKDLWRNFCHAFCRCNSETLLDIHSGASIYAIALNCARRAHWCLGYTAVMRARITASASKCTVSSAPKHKPETLAQYRAASFTAARLGIPSVLRVASIVLLSRLATARGALGDVSGRRFHRQSRRDHASLPAAGDLHNFASIGQTGVSPFCCR